MYRIPLSTGPPPSSTFELHFISRFVNAFYNSSEKPAIILYEDERRWLVIVEEKRGPEMVVVKAHGTRKRGARG